MSTRSTTHFTYKGVVQAIIYRHTDGYPSGAGADIDRFFAAVEEQTKDTRFTDPNYLAAKYVVFLANEFAWTYKPDPQANGWTQVKSNQLDFLSVGVVMEDPGDIEYRYIIDCGNLTEDGRPSVTCHEMGWGAGDRVLASYNQGDTP